MQMSGGKKATADHCFGGGPELYFTFTLVVQDPPYRTIHKATNRDIPTLAWYNSHGMEKIP